MHTPTLSPASTFYGFEDDVFEVILHEPTLAERIPEALVQDIWLTQAFNHQALQTVTGQAITILHAGRLNTDSGPDFKEARIRIGTVEWAGDVEIHKTSHDWDRHNHGADPRYNPVILHVVLQADMWTGQLKREDQTILPELILAPHLQTPLRSLLYHFLTRPPTELPCASHWPSLAEPLKRSWLAKLAKERLLAKRDALAESYLQTPDLAPLLHERLFAGLGYSKNTKAMRMLAHRLPLSLIQHLDDPLDLEALHLGTAGLLPTEDQLLQADDATRIYLSTLWNRYATLSTSFAIDAMPPTMWQFFRLRPTNFPPLRIAQGTALLRSNHFLRDDPISQLTEALQAPDALARICALLQVPLGPFWETHVRLEKPLARKQSGLLGKQRAFDLIINAILPVMLLHAQQREDPTLETACFSLLHNISAASDEITRHFQALGAKAKNAFEAQGFHQLYRTRCMHSHCLTCAIGKEVLKSV